MAKKKSLLLSLLLLGPTFAVAADVGPVHATGLDYPNYNESLHQPEYFPKCTVADQEFCIELFEITLDSGGGTQVISDPVNDAGHQINAFISGTYSGPDGPKDMGGLFPALAINYYDVPGSYHGMGDPPTSTVDGLDAGTYRVKLRTGDYDPSYLLLTGEHVNYSWEQGPDGYFTVDLTARPKPTAMVVALGGDQTLLNTCTRNSWIKDCESNSPYRSYLLASYVMAPTAAERGSLRGTWISTNASMFSLGTVNFATGEFAINAAGPHYLPTDFNVPGYAKDVENGRDLNPATFKMFIPYKTIADLVTRMIGISITPDQVKTFFDQPQDAMSATIEKLTGKSVTEATQSLTITMGDAGVTIDFNLTHFSAPNPRLAIARAIKRLPTNGAIVRSLRLAAKGRTYSSKVMFAPGAGTGISSVKSSTAKICKTVGSSVKMLKPGTCKLTVKTLKSRKSASTLVTIKVT